MKKSLSIFFFALLAFISAAPVESIPSPNIPNIPQAIGILYGLGMVLFGVGTVFLLFGLKLFKVIIFMSGFFSMFSATFFVMGGFTLATKSDAGAQIFVDFILSILLGIAGGYIALCCQKVSIFLVGFACGGAILFFLTALAFNMSQEGMGAASIMGFIGAIIGGILAIKIFDQVIILLTSLAGSAIMIYAANIFISGGNIMKGLGLYPLEYGAAAIILAVAGIIYQNKTKPPKVEDGADKKLINSPELMLVNVHYSPPVTDTTQVSAYSSISQIPAQGMNDQQKAYYNP